MTASNGSEIAVRRTRALARLAVEVGANVAPGQDVVVLAYDVEYAGLARELADAAYQAGAHYVSVLYWDQHVKRSRLLHADDDTLDYTPGWWDRHIEECLERRSASIVVWGDPNPDLLNEIDPARAGRDSMPLTGPLHAMHASGEVNWTVIPGASSGVARRLLGSDDVDALWDVFAPILRLDAEDPVKAWREHVAHLRTRAEGLNAHGFEALRFHGPGTDLTLGLLRGALWIAAGFETNWGREMIANMPTEEVFTTPDYRVAEGTVAATRPFQLIGGPTVEGLRLRFEGGRVVEVEADVGADAIRARLESDEGAARLGEVALVDGTSPIGRSGHVFKDILFDENATCHIALGNGYSFTVPDLPEDQYGRERRGFNLSGIHQDLMIGGPEVAVDGLDGAGNATPILRDDVWLLE
ncbi:MAG: aminopeptidase [Solirubrobacterales bacterium]|nr:aminopeptidase [Solirubrobacterales bacterium]